MKKFYAGLFIVAFIVSFTAFEAGLADYIDSLQLNFGVMEYTVFLLFIVLTYHISIIVHELGHLVFGKLSGLRFLSFRYMSFVLLKNADGNIIFTRYSIMGTAGQCIMIPDKEKDMPLFWFNAGGVIMNGLAILLAVLFILWDLGFYMNAFWVIFLIINALLIILNWLPWKHLSNDGNNYREAKRHVASKEAFKSLLLLHEKLIYGNRLSEMDLSDVMDRTLDVTHNLERNLALIVALKHLYSLDFKAYSASIEAIKSNVNLDKGMLNGLIKPYVYLCELIENSDQALSIKDKQTTTLLKSMRHEALFVLISWYELLIINRVSDETLSKRFFLLCDKSPAQGESEDLKALYEALHARHLSYESQIMD